ncbi:MAG: GNAT family N-acetyltransferase [Pseudomonadota bacterium]
MEIVSADAALAERYADEIPELVYATGPSSYDYHFQDRALFDELVRRSWLAPGTLFAWDGTRLALDGETLLGIEIGFEGAEYRPRQSALGELWPALFESGVADEAALTGVITRSDHASWLNPVTRPGVWYVHALSVKPEARGRRLGRALLENAMDLGRKAAFRALELDVLSDNPAVEFYRAMGLELLVESRAPDPEAHGVPPEWRMSVNL